MSTTTVMDNSNEIGKSCCVNCGKGEECAGDLKACTACKLVKYCNRDCQIAHRPQHKKACKKRAAELHDEALFKQPPPKEDCPICFLLLPSMDTGVVYMQCCGKIICCGCMDAPIYDNQGKVVGGKKCPFCRTPPADSNEEVIERLQKREEAGDAEAVYQLGIFYRDGNYGLPQDYERAFELFFRAGELGRATAYNNIGYAYENGRGVERNEKKADHYFELAAIRGDATARYNLGVREAKTGNMEKAAKHLIIAIKGGHNNSLKLIQEMYSNGDATKENYATALRAYQAYLMEIKSAHRDEAAAADRDHYY